MPVRDRNAGSDRDPASIPLDPAADSAALMNPIPPRSRIACPAVTKMAVQLRAVEEAPRFLLLRLPPPVQGLDRRLATHLDNRRLASWPALAACLNRHWPASSPHASRFRDIPHASRILRRSRTHPARNARTAKRRDARPCAAGSSRATPQACPSRRAHFSISCETMRNCVAARFSQGRVLALKLA